MIEFAAVDIVKATDAAEAAVLGVAVAIGVSAQLMAPWNFE